MQTTKRTFLDFSDIIKRHRLLSETLGKVDPTELLRQAVNGLRHVLDSGSRSSEGSELLSCHFLFYFDSLVFACVFLSYFFIAFLPVLVFPPFHLHLYKIAHVSLCLRQAVFSLWCRSRFIPVRTLVDNVWIFFTSSEPPLFSLHVKMLCFKSLWSYKFSETL